MPTFTILPTQNITAGSHQTPELPINDAWNDYEISFDRNSWPPTAELSVIGEISIDGGEYKTFMVMNDIGGDAHYDDPDATLITKAHCNSTFPPGVNRKIRINYTINEQINSAIQVTVN